MTRLAAIADRLAVGSRAYSRRLGSRAAAWCARGRRNDLRGWRGALGIFLRIILLGFGAYLLARLVRSLPALMWVLTGWWTLASWRAGKAVGEAAEEDSEGAPDVEVVRTLLLDLMGTGSGVHLRTVLAHLQQHPPTAARTAAWTVTDLRSRLERQGIPVHPKVKVAGTPTTGVRREDLQAPSPARETDTSPSGRLPV